MALAFESTRVTITGTGTRGPFPIAVAGVPVTFAASAHLRVTRYNSANVATILTEGLDYTVSRASVLPPVGTAYPQTVLAADVNLTGSQPVLAANEHLVIERNSPRTQEVVLTGGGGFSSAANERGYDAIVRQIQELTNKVGRTLRVHALDPTVFQELDQPAALRTTNKIIGFDALGRISVVDRPTNGINGLPGAVGPPGPAGPPGPLGSGSGDVLGPATNADQGFPVWNGVNTRTLKDLTLAQMRTLLGLGSAALVNTNTFFQLANNLGEGNPTVMRNNLGIGSAGVLTAAQVHQVANNLSEGDHAAQRGNLGLGSAAQLPVMLTSEFWANTPFRVLTTDTVWASAVPRTLGESASIVIDMSIGFNFNLTLTGNRTLANPSNQKIGQSGFLYIVQDATGSRTLAYGTNWKFPGGVPPVLSLGAGAIDILHFEILAANYIFASLIKDVR